MKIYIAGKITGEPKEACMAKFKTAEDKLRDLGAAPVNPFKLGIPQHFTFEESKPFNFKALRHCSSIFLLNDYMNSPGAIAELDEALRLGLEVFYEDFDGYESVSEAIRLGTISAGY